MIKTVLVTDAYILKASGVSGISNVTITGGTAHHQICVILRVFRSTILSLHGKDKPFPCFYGDNYFIRGQPAVWPGICSSTPHSVVCCVLTLETYKPVHIGDRPVACCDCQKSFSRSYRGDMVDSKRETSHLPANAVARRLLFGPLWRDTGYDWYVCCDYGKAFILPFSLHNEVAMKMTVAAQDVVSAASCCHLCNWAASFTCPIQ